MDPIPVKVPALRVWIVAPVDWQPGSPLDIPKRAVALFPAREECMTPIEAEEFIAGFNEQMLVHGAIRWAVARRVELRVENDFVRGRPIA